MGNNPTGRCKLCGETAELQHSHIISKFFHKPMQKESAQYFEILTKPYSKKKKQGGVKEYLLCKECEVKRSKWERYVSNFVSDKASTEWQEIYPLFFRVTGIDYKSIKLFALSTLWLMSISELPNFPGISLGKHEDVIRAMLLAENPGSKFEYSIFLHKLQEDWARKMYDIRGEPERIANHYHYRWALGGYIWNIIVSSHKVEEDALKAVICEDGSALISLGSIMECEWVKESFASKDQKQ